MSVALTRSLQEFRVAGMAVVHSHRSLIRSVILTGLLCLLPDRCPALDHISRTVAIFYDSSVERSPDQSLARMFIEGPLNSLGVVAKYSDVNQKELYSSALAPEIRAIVSAFPAGTRLKDPEIWIDLLIKALDLGKKVIIIGEPGFLVNRDGNIFAKGALHRVFSRFGVEFNGEFAHSSIDYRPVVNDEHLASGNTLQPSMVQVPRLITNSRARVLVRGEPLQKKDAPIPLAVIEPRSGLLSLTDAAFSYVAGAAGTRPLRIWNLNPFKLFSEVLELGDMPRADLTSAYGSRLLIVLFQGSGWSENSRVERYLHPATTAIEALERHFIVPNRSVIFTVAPVMAELTGTLGRPALLRKARDILLAENVAVATTGFSNVYQWPAPGGSLVKHEFRHHDPDPAIEIGAALEELGKLVGSDHQEGCYVNEANTLSSEARSYISANNRCALSGGQTRFDPLHPAPGWLDPVSAPALSVDKEESVRPILFPMAGERDFILDRGSPNYAYRYLQQTIEATESPIRLTAIGVRAGIRAGASPVRFSALEKVFAALPESVFSLSVTDYAELVHDFQRVHFGSCGTQCWRILNRGDLQSIKFHLKKGRRIDYRRSHGVSGARVINDELFISLDPDVPEPEVALTESPDPPPPELLESNWIVRDLDRSAQRVSFKTGGKGDGRIVIRMPGSGELAVSAFVRGDQLLEKQPAAELEGDKLTLRFNPERADQIFRVTIRRGEAE